MADQVDAQPQSPPRLQMRSVSKRFGATVALDDVDLTTTIAGKTLRAPLIIGGLMSNMDMLTTVYCYGSPEMALLSAAYTDITKWLGVPEYETAGCSDAKMFDEQAALEATMNITTAALVGGNMIHDVGYLEQGLTSSMEMMVASDEIIDRVKRILRGIPVTDETRALDVMDEVGSLFRLEGKKGSVVKINDVERVVSAMARIPPQTVSTSDREKLKTLDRDLKLVIYGQDQAIEALAATTLQQENRRLEEKLRQAELIIDVQKKVSEMLNTPLKTPDGEGID